MFGSTTDTYSLAWPCLCHVVLYKVGSKACERMQVTYALQQGGGTINSNWCDYVDVMPYSRGRAICLMGVAESCRSTCWGIYKWMDHVHKKCILSFYKNAMLWLQQESLWMKEHGVPLLTLNQRLTIKNKVNVVTAKSRIREAPWQDMAWSFEHRHERKQR